MPNKALTVQCAEHNKLQRLSDSVFTFTMTSKTTPVRLDPVTGKKIPPPVSAKPVRMTATRLTKANIPKPPPTPLQPSFGHKSAEEELDALTDLLVKNLENTSDPDFFGELTNFIVDRIPAVNVLCFSCVRKVNFQFSGS